MTLFVHRVVLVAGACVLTTLCFGVVAAAAVMVETVGQLTRVEGGGAVAMTLWALAIIECAYQALAVSVLVGCAFVTVLWARKGEALAAAQLGLSPIASEGPLWVGSLLVCLLFAVLAHEGVPRAVASRNAIMRAHLRQGDGLSRAYVEPPTWFFLPDRLLFVPAQHAQAREALPCREDDVCFADPVVYGWRRGRIDSVTQAVALGTEGSVLSLYDATTHSMDSPARDVRARSALPKAFLPRQLSQLLGNPREMSSGSLVQLIERRRAAHLPADSHRWELASRTSSPLTSFASLVLAAPFLLSFDRRRTLAHNVLHAAWVACASLLFLQIGRALAISHDVSVPSAAALPAGICALGRFLLVAWPLAKPSARRLAR